MQHLLPPPHDRAISLDDVVPILTRIPDHDAGTLRSESDCDVRTYVRTCVRLLFPCSREAIVFAESSEFYIVLLMIGSAR